MTAQSQQSGPYVEQSALSNPAAANSDQMVPRLRRKGIRTISLALDGIDFLSRIDGWLGGLCLVALGFLMLAGIAVRGLSNVFSWLPRDLPIAWEYSSYLMATTFTFGAAMTLRVGAHIRVRLLLGIASAPYTRILESLSSVVAASFAAFFSYAMIRFSWLSYTLDERSIASNTPLWLPKSLVAIGVSLLALQFLARAVRALLDLPLEERSLINVAPRVEIP